MRHFFLMIIFVLFFSLLFVWGVESKTPVYDEWERLNELLDLFDEQIDRLKDRGCPDFIIDRLWGMKFKVVDRACNMSIRRGNIPFLPVIPDSWLSYARQMEMVRKNDSPGVIELNVSGIENWREVSKEPYYIFDVNDGWKGRGYIPSDVERVIRNNQKMPMVVEELISLCIHTEILNRHNVGALDSRYGKSSAPGIFMKRDIPTLDWFFLEALPMKCGFPYSRNLHFK